MVATNCKWKVSKRKKPPKWWLISSYKNDMRLWSGGLFPDAECKICKYKLLIISVYASGYGGTDTMPRDGGGT